MWASKKVADNAEMQISARSGPITILPSLTLNLRVLCYNLSDYQGLTEIVINYRLKILSINAKCM